MSLHSYITLGNSGLRVSPFCLGTMTFGNDRGWGSSPGVDEVAAAVEEARKDRVCLGRTSSLQLRKRCGAGF